jgi:hypothetical protein
MIRRRRRTEKKNSIAVPIFIIAIMVLSGLGYALLQSKENSDVKRFGNFKFVKTGDVWKTNIDNLELGFYYAPDELEAIPADNISALPYMLYLTSKKDAQYSQQKLMAIDLAKFELKNTLLALGYTPTMSFSNLITCKNATKTVAVVDLDIGNETAVRISGTCVKITGVDERNLIAARDKFLMLIIGII